MQSNCPPSTNAELVNRYVRGRDADAFSELVRRTGPMVFAVASRETPRLEDAEDVTQIVFAELARRAGTIEDPAAVGGWLHTVTLRTAGRIRRRPVDASLASDPEDSRVRPDLDRLAAQSDLDALNEELERLPDSWREPLLLRYFAGCTNEESALRLGLTEKAVEGRLKRGRNTLRVRLLRRGVRLAIAIGAAEAAFSKAAAAAPSDWSATGEAALELSRDPDPFPDLTTAQGAGFSGAAAVGGRALPVALAAAVVVLGLSPGGVGQAPRPHVTLSTMAAAEPIEASLASPPQPIESLLEASSADASDADEGEPRQLEIGMRNAPIRDVAALFSDLLDRPVVVDEESFRRFGRSVHESVTAVFPSATPSEALSEVAGRHLGGVEVRESEDRLVLSAGGPSPEPPDFFGSAVDATNEPTEEFLSPPRLMQADFGMPSPAIQHSDFGIGTGLWWRPATVEEPTRPEEILEPSLDDED